MDKKESYILFGGSFDPVQRAHTEIIDKLSERFKKVIVAPSFISPFKPEGGSANAELRIKMLQTALDGKKNTEIDPFEIENGGVSYTINTVEHILSKYGLKKLYLALGADNLPGLYKWHNFDTLAQKVTFYVIERDGFTIKKSVLKRLNVYGAAVEIADFKAKDGVSSTKARLDAAFGRFDDLPQGVKEIVVKNKLYDEFCPIVNAFGVFNLSKERIRHIYRTTLAAVTLAKRFKANIKDAVTAALLHDIAKEADGKLLKSLNITPPPETDGMPDKIRHAFIGAEAAKIYFNIKKRSVIDAVKYHTTAAPKMSKLAKIIFLADIIEDGRTEDDFVYLPKIRELSKTSLNEALAAAIKSSVDRLSKKGKEVYKLTIQAYDYYVNKNIKPLKEAIAKSASNNESKEPDAELLAKMIAAFLSEKKARDVEIVDLVGKTIIADYFVIASVFSTTAVKALIDYVDEKLSKDFGIEPIRRELDKSWSAIDYGSVILHVQTDEVRKRYDLADLWNKR